MIAKQEHINSSEPATKGDLEQLREDLQADIVNTAERVKEETLNEMKHYFDAAVEVLRDDFKGATKDKIVTLEDKQEDHEQRITILEKQATR